MSGRWVLARRARLKRDTVRGMDVLLVPESVLELNAQGAEILRMCDGTRTVEEIAEELSCRYGGADVARDVRTFVGRLADRGLLVPAA